MNDDDVLRAFAERPLPPSLVDVGRAVQAGRRRQRTRLALVAAAVVGVVAAGAVAALVYAYRSGRHRMVGRRTFYKLARASRLARKETSLLVEVSRRVLPDNPPEIFVRRSLFESAVADMSADAALVTSVRKKVYGP